MPKGAIGFWEARLLGSRGIGAHLVRGNGDRAWLPNDLLRNWGKTPELAELALTGFRLSSIMKMAASVCFWG